MVPVLSTPSVLRHCWLGKTKPLAFISWPTFPVLCQPLCLCTVWSGITGRIPLQTTADQQMSQILLHLHLRAIVLNGVHWTVAVVSERVCDSSWSLLSVYTVRRVATHYSTPDSLKWTLYLIKHYIALKITIFQSLFIRNIWINIKICKKSSHYFICFNLCSLILNWHCIWPAGGLHGLSQTGVVHWSRHQPSVINTYLQWLCAQLRDLVPR